MTHYICNSIPLDNPKTKLHTALPYITIAIIHQSQDQEWNTNRDRIRCYKCREYDLFTKDCPTAAKAERETEQIQQMFNLDEEQTTLKTLAIDTYDSLNCVRSIEEVK